MGEDVKGLTAKEIEDMAKELYQVVLLVTTQGNQV